MERVCVRNIFLIFPISHSSIPFFTVDAGIDRQCIRFIPVPLWLRICPEVNITGSVLFRGDSTVTSITLTLNKIRKYFVDVLFRPEVVEDPFRK